LPIRGATATLAWMRRRARPKSLVLILARDLASRLATPAFLVDERGTLVYFNEAAETVLAATFAEVGEMPAEDWSSAFSPMGTDGRAVPLEQLPLGIALTERQATHGRLRITAADGKEKEISATALPLYAHADDLEGALALFWEEPRA
jgi:PAS domain-containing protein